MNPDRRYALVRLAKGDYLLLSNDGKTLWRISTYTEDGSAVTDDGRVLAGTFWGTWRYRRAVQGGQPISADDWSDFEMDDCLLKTRKEAIRAVLTK